MTRAAAPASSPGPAGKLYLVPAPLDFRLGDAAPVELAELVPMQALRVAARLEHWVCENAKSARALLKRVDATLPLARPLQQIAIAEWPRPTARRSDAERATMDRLLAPAIAGHDLGLLSEAGLAAVADPGAGLVAAAHARGIGVVALPGASAITLAVAASGLDGQSFAFVGYVPAAAEARANRLRELEALSRKLGQTQLMIETPYRNAALWSALVATLHDETLLSVSVGLTGSSGYSRTERVGRWRGQRLELADDVPAMFALLAR